MYKGLQYLDRAIACRKMAHQVRDAQHREQLEDMAQEWEALAAERASELAKARKRAQAQTGPAGRGLQSGGFRRARPFLYIVKPR
jgi:hypothetical protein